MWIVNKKGNIFNTDCIGTIHDDFGPTYAVIGDKPHLISPNPVAAIILEALRRGDNFVEVD